MKQHAVESIAGVHGVVQILSLIHISTRIAKFAVFRDFNFAFPAFHKKHLQGMTCQAYPKGGIITLIRCAYSFGVSYSVSPSVLVAPAVFYLVLFDVCAFKKVNP